MSHQILSIDTPTDNLRGLASALVRLGAEFPEALAKIPGGESVLTITEGEIQALAQADEDFYAAQRDEIAAREIKNVAFEETEPQYDGLRRQLKLLARFEASTSGLSEGTVAAFPYRVRPAQLPTRLEELVKVASALDPLARPAYSDARLAELTRLAGDLRVAQGLLADTTAHRRAASDARQEARDPRVEPPPVRL